MKRSTGRRLEHALLLALVTVAVACSSSSSPHGPWQPGQPLTLDVGQIFPAGSTVHDAYSGKTATVAANGNVTVTPDASGVVLLEAAGATPTPFNWKNASVYFAITDRFANGDPSNDRSYGRTPDGAQEIGTWHGGDWRGLTGKLDYIQALGVTAIWISPIVEQVHGWVASTSGDFRNYGYAGYWALDFTRLDENFGSAADLQALVDGAHARGIRVLADVVMNHPGYATGADLEAYLPEVFFDGTGAAFLSWTPPATGNYNNWNDLVNYDSTGWQNWWSPNWIRAGSTPQQFPGFDKPGTDNLTESVAYLPDFKTESTTPAGVPVLFTRKAARPGDATGVVEIPGATVRDYLVSWHTAWVSQFGFDGFRCDTALNVELASWSALKTAAVVALRNWKASNPQKAIDGSDFWMTGEVYGHGVSKDGYYTVGGFDSLINFDYLGWLRDELNAKGTLVAAASDLDDLYSHYAGLISTDPAFNILSYISSHDTRLWFGDIAAYDRAKQLRAGTALFLTPGGVQIFYGDESGRTLGPAGSDTTAGTRSDMNWATTDPAILAHWQKLGNFRKSHAAIGAGSHAKLASPAGTYAFTRSLDTGSMKDAVVVVIGAPN